MTRCHVTSGVAATPVVMIGAKSPLISPSCCRYGPVLYAWVNGYATGVSHHVNYFKVGTSSSTQQIVLQHAAESRIIFSLSVANHCSACAMSLRQPQHSPIIPIETVKEACIGNLRLLLHRRRVSRTGRRRRLLQRVGPRSTAASVPLPWHSASYR